MAFWAMTDWMVWPPSLSRDRKWPRVTKYTHSQDVIRYDNFRKTWRTKFIFAHQIIISPGNIGQVCIWRSSGQGQGHRRWCETAMGNNSGSIKLRAMKFVCSMGFRAMTDWMVWPPSLSHDRKWPCVTKCTHSRSCDKDVMNYNSFSGVLRW